MDDVRSAESASQPDAPTPFADVLRAEMKVVLGRELPPFDPGRCTGKPSNLDQEIQAREAVDNCGTRVAALCLSGGGIRSATFALGVLQGLARFGLLDQFHYLSSVSGGGYIASWLSMWRHRVADPDIVNSLNVSLATGAEASEIVGIRKDSNYLTPTLGLLSADTWTLVTLYVRNLLLNWIMFVPFFMGVLAFPRVCASALEWIAGLPAVPAFNCARVLGSLFVFIGLAVGVYGRFRKQGQWLTNARFLWWSMGFLVLSAEPPPGEPPRPLDLTALEALAQALLKRESLELGLESRDA